MVRPTQRTFIAIAVLATAYVVSARLGLSLAFVEPSVTAVWPPAGVALAGLLLLGARAWPGVALGELIASLSTGTRPSILILVVTANTLQAVLGTLVLRRLGFRTELDRVRDVIALVAAGALLSPLLSASLGTLAHHLFAPLQAGPVGTMWLTWWLGDATGVLLVVPLIVLLENLPKGRARTLELAALALTLVGSLLVVFFGGLHQPYLIAPALGWAALRFGQRAAAVSAVTTAVFGIAATVTGRGPFVHADVNASLLELQGFLAVMTLSALLLAAILSERLRAEAALRSSEERYRTLLENLPVGVYRTTPDGHLLEANPATATMLGFVSTDELRSARVPDLYVEPESRRHHLQQLAAQPSASAEFELRRADGQTLWVRDHPHTVLAPGGDVRYIDGVLVDVTKRRRAEEELLRVHEELEARVAQRTRQLEDAVRTLNEEIAERQRAEQQLELLGHAIRSVSECISITDIDNRILFVNEAFLNTYGYSERELFGRPIEMLWASSVPEELSREVRESTLRGGWHGEITNRRKDGREFPVLLSTSPLRDEEGEAVALIGVATDNTDRRQLEEQVRQAQKMEALGRLAGGIAHDFNNLLQAELSTLAVMRAARDDEARFGAAVGELEAQVKRGAALARQLLLFARREVAKPQRLDVNRVITGAVVLLERLVPENIRLVVDLAPAHLGVDADRGQLEQILVNLVVNAVDAMPGGGELRVGTGGSDESVWFEVADSGTGMAPDVMARIFEPFFTTKTPDKGTGLGLAVVDGIVRQHGGRVEVASAPGEGSRFRVLLPLRPYVERPDAAPATLAEPVGGRGERVLVVEDEPGTRASLVQVLAMLGYRPLPAASGEEAETIAREQGFELLLTDLMLPGIDGHELARRLKQQHPNIGVVVMSGYTEDEGIRRGVRAGAIRFLQKPFDMETLARELRPALQAIAAR